MEVVRDYSDCKFGNEMFFGVPNNFAIPIERHGLRIDPKVVVASSLVLATLLSGCGTVTDVVGGVAGGTVNAAGGFFGALPGFFVTEVGQFVGTGILSSFILSLGSEEGLRGIFSKRGLDRALALPIILFLFKNSNALWTIADSGRATIGAFGGLALQTVANVVKNDLTPGFFDGESLKEKLVCAVLGGVTGEATGNANLPGTVIPGLLTLGIALGGIPHFGREQQS